MSASPSSPTSTFKTNPFRGQRAGRSVGLIALLAVISISPLAAQDMGQAAAQEAATKVSEVSYVLNTLLFLFGGFLVMWMAAGFCMLEAGLVRSKNVADICLKNILLYAVACIMFFGLGYNLMYGIDAGGFIGSPLPWGADDSKAAAGDFSGNYAAGSDFFFQMVFVATTASIVSGTVAERIRLVPFLVFTVVLAGVIYPIQGGWKWGLGWLETAGFLDFAGSTVVHSVGGWAALTGAYFLGARKGRYDRQGRVRPMPGSNLPMATLGTFILWLGWFGFNGASQLAMSSASDSIAIANVFVNTNMAAAAGTVVAAVLTRLRYGKFDLTMTLNGALAGLVSITAAPDTPSIPLAMFIGGVGSALAVIAVPLFDKIKIDDVVGAISVHLVGGIWGTLAVVLSNESATLGAQLLGIGAIGGFVIITSSITWLAIKATIGLRLSEEDEVSGADIAELGIEAYPEFGTGSQRMG